MFFFCLVFGMSLCAFVYFYFYLLVSAIMFDALTYSIFVILVNFKNIVLSEAVMAYAFLVAGIGE